MSEKRYDFLGCAVDALTQQEAIEAVRCAAKDRFSNDLVLFLNVDVLVKADRNDKLKRAINSASLSLMDGTPPLKIARRMGLPLPEKVSGSDLVPKVCDMAAAEGLSVFFLGGSQDSSAKAAEITRKSRPGIGRVSSYSPPLGFEASEEQVKLAVGKVRESAPDILVLCLGCPKQEVFALDHMAECDAPVTICAGATVDFIAGNVQRSPEWVSRLGCEWLYRFLKEPKRLFRRYFVDSWHLLAMIKKNQKGLTNGTRLLL